MKSAQDAVEQIDPPPPLSQVAQSRLNKEAKETETRPRPPATRTREPPAEPWPPGTPSPLKPPAYVPEGFCKDCFVPVADDPDPETLFIYLHALRYTTESLGVWETPMPRWAAEKWDGEWRGGCDESSPTQ